MFNFYTKWPERSPKAKSTMALNQKCMHEEYNLCEKFHGFYADFTDFGATPLYYNKEIPNKMNFEKCV